MTPEELFDKHKHIAEATVYKHFKDPKGIARKYNVEMQDLFQYAYEALFEACLDFNSEKGNRSFQNFAITKIKWNLSAKLQRDCKNFSFRGTNLDARGIRKNTKFVSLDDMANSDKGEDNVTYHELIGDDYILEGEAVGKVLHQMIGEKFPERTVVALNGKMEGRTLHDIGEQFGVSREQIRQDLLKLKRKLVGVM